MSQEAIVPIVKAPKSSWEILKAETASVRASMGHDNVTDEEYAEAWTNAQRDFIYIPSQQRYTRAASATNSDRLASIQVVIFLHCITYQALGSEDT